MTAFLVDPATGLTVLVAAALFVGWALLGVVVSLPLPRVYEQRQREGDFLVREYLRLQAVRCG